MDAEVLEPTDPGPNPRWRAIGIDRVRRELDGQLVVEAAVEMPEWRASRFRPTVVVFRGERFRVDSQSHERRGPHVYQLKPWPDDGVEQPGAVIEYDERYVRLRQKLRTANRVASVFATLATPLTPLLGFLPSGVKVILQGLIGLHPLAATQASVGLEKMAAMLCGAFAMIHLFTGGSMTPELVHTYWLAPLLTIDAIGRLDSLLREETPPPGFLEWLLPARFRRIRRKVPAQFDRSHS